MPKEFSHAARWTKEHIAVPALDMQQISQRSRRVTTVERLRLSAAAVCAALLVAGTGTGFAQRTYNGIRIWLSGDTAAVRIQSMATTQYPTPTELRSIAARTVVPFVYPVGLPSAMKIRTIAYWPVNRPNTIMLLYSNGTGGLVAFTVVANSAVMQGAPPAQTLRGRGIRWSAGNEQVLARVDPAHPAQRAVIANVRSAMQKTTPAASLAAELARTHNIVILGGFSKVVRDAEAIARGNAVLIDRGHLAEIPALAAAHKPLLASRTVEMTDIPQQNGPDYTHAKYTWEKSVVLSAEAVRAVDAALSTHGGLPKCGCEILYDLQSGGPRVTLLPAR